MKLEICPLNALCTNGQLNSHNNCCLFIYFMTELKSCCDFQLMKVSSGGRVYSLQVQRPSSVFKHIGYKSSITIGCITTYGVMGH